MVGQNYQDDYGSSTVTACYWNNAQSGSIGEEQTDTGQTAKVINGDWTDAKDAMNAALSGTGWQYELTGAFFRAK